MTNPSVTGKSEGLLLTGLDGSNPLGFLAAMGVLRLADMTWPDCRPQMRWLRQCGGFRPHIEMRNPPSQESFAQDISTQIKADFQEHKPPYCYGPIISCPQKEFRKRAADAAVGASLARNRHVVDFFTGFACDAVLKEDTNPKDQVETTPLSFANGQSHRNLLGDYMQMVVGAKTKAREYAAVDAACIHRALFEHWRYEDDHKELRWEPIELRLAAFSPVGGSVHGANVLAFWALSMLPAVPCNKELAVVGMTQLPVDGTTRQQRVFSWPIWEHPLGVDPVRSVLACRQIQRKDDDVDHISLRKLGIVAVYRSEKIEYQKGLYFTPARRI